ncbi:MAG TPA: adenylate/guanylate cyclase domain-containing protein [Caulobacteraceae bacterium]|jgi:adenylate cyclase|nr:adenylate/guanylate cyclase domain-containing protein [Caulobacteraceae bacterium]
MRAARSSSSDLNDAEPSLARSHWRPFLFAVGVLVVLCAFCAPLFIDRIAADGPKAHDGYVSFSDWKSWGSPVELGGTWRLVWRGPIVAGGPRAGDSIELQVPGGWRGLKTASGAPFPEMGLATYQLTIHGLKPGSYTLFIPTVFHASRVWLDRRLVAQMGQVGTTPQTTRYLWRAYEIPIESHGSDVHLAIDLAAFHHRNEGLEASPVLGQTSAMSTWLAIEWSKEFLQIATLLLIFVYGVIAYSYRPGDYPSLYVALTYASYIPVLLILGHDNIIAIVYPDIDFTLMNWIGYTASIFSLMFLLAYTRSLFVREASGPLYYTFQVLFIVALITFSVLFAFDQTVAASYLFRYFSLAAILALVYIVVVVTIAAVRGRSGANVFLIGIALFGLSVFVWIIYQANIVPNSQLVGVDLVPMGLFLFSFSQMIILAERWSTALNAAETMATDMRRLMEVSSSIASEMQLGSLLRTIVEATSRFLYAERSSLFLHDPKSGELWSMVAEGVDTREIRMAADAGIAGHAFSQGEVVIVNDAYADPRFNRSVDELTGYTTRTMLTMPVVTRDGRRLGVMQALNRKDRSGFGSSDISRMRAFAAQAAVAIDNATLFSEIVAARNYNESILGSMSNGVITLGADGRVEKLNAAAARILEIDADPVVGAMPETVLAEANAWVLGELDAVRAEGEPRTLLDVDVVTGKGRTISANLSIVPLIADEASVGLLILIEDISQEKRLEGAMRRFMTQRVVDQVLQRQDELLFGSACVASVLFADIRNFTTMAESLRPRETVDMLNEVFTELVEAVSANDGVLDKFIGDAVMAVYGAPLSSGRDPENAVESAIAMMRLLALLNQRRAERGHFPLRLGIGVATGELIAGTIGSPRRMDYTVIGDSVNLASRLQGATKHYQVGVVVCEATAMANADIQILRHLDTVGVRGRNRPEKIYQVLSYHTEASFPHMREVLSAYGFGMERQQAQDWGAAAEAFAHALRLNPEDKPSELMLERVRAAMRTPESQGWGQPWATPEVG